MDCQQVSENQYEKHWSSSAWDLARYRFIQAYFVISSFKKIDFNAFLYLASRGDRVSRVRRLAVDLHNCENASERLHTTHVISVRITVPG